MATFDFPNICFKQRGLRLFVLFFTLHKPPPCGCFKAEHLTHPEKFLSTNDRLSPLRYLGGLRHST